MPACEQVRNLIFVASPLQTGVFLFRSAVSTILMVVTILSLHPCLRSDEMWQCRGRVMQAKLADEQAWLKLCGAQSSMGARNGMISWTRSALLGWCWKLRVFRLYCKFQTRRTGPEPPSRPIWMMSPKSFVGLPSRTRGISVSLVAEIVDKRKRCACSLTLP